MAENLDNAIRDNAAVRYLPGQVQPISTQPTGDCGCRGASASGPNPVASGNAASGMNEATPAKRTPNAIPVTRASCLECVEKHLGAAYVLLTETRDGYAHRLRAVGHLHEAEDESQEFPTLHAAIRDARKTYQTDGNIPDWEALAHAAEVAQQTDR